MTALELGLCITAVLSSSVSQLFIKAAAGQRFFGRGIVLLGVGASLLICSVLLVVVALRTLNLSRLISFAALAYVLVPIGSCCIFRERLRPRFWCGAFLIVTGILCVNF